MNTPERRRLRDRLFSEQHGKCFYCTRKMSTRPWHLIPGRVASFAATFDHIIPTSLGGSVSLYHNTVLACNQCNNERGNRDAREFLFEKMGLTA